MKYRCLTNNPMVYSKNLSNIEFIEGTPLDLFIAVKKEVLKGYRLVTHPLTSSLPPNINPYKTVFLSMEAYEEIDIDSLNIIENAIEYTESLMKNKPLPDWDERTLEDFQFVDKDLINNLL